MICLSTPYNVLVQHFQNLDSKDLGSYDVSMTTDRRLLGVAVLSHSRLVCLFSASFSRLISVCSMLRFSTFDGSVSFICMSVDCVAVLSLLVYHIATVGHHIIVTLIVPVSNLLWLVWVSWLSPLSMVR